jgi:hypothetical protein
MNQITINGKTYKVKGKNISVNNNSIIVDGVLVQSDLSGIVEVKFEGDLANIESHNLKVKGNVAGDIDAHNVECGDVGGNVKAHNIECKTINGDAKAKNISKGW